MPQFNIKQVKGSTQGSVLFLGTNARVSEDRDKFYWDITNNSLLLGTSSIFGTERLRVYGNQRIDGDLFVTGSFSVLGSASVINTQNLTIQDPIILLASTQSGSPILDSGFFINRGTGATQAFIWDESADEFVFIQTSDSSTVIGNVNISSYANIRANGATFAQVKITSGAASGYILISDSAGLASWTSSIPNGVTGSGVVNYVPRWLSSTNLSATGSIYDDGANVGIGTLSPTSRLHMVGSGTTSATFAFKVENSALTPLFNVRNDGNVSLNNAVVSGTKLYLNGGATVDNTYAFRVDGDSANILNVLNEGSVGFGSVASPRMYIRSDGNIGINFTSGAINGTKVYLDGGTTVANQYALRIDGDGSGILNVQNNGTVGIGTTTPTTKLHVSSTQSGAFRLVDTTQAAGYFLVSDANGVGTWTSSTGGLSTANNGLTYSGSNVQMGGPLIRETLISNTSYPFTMSSTSIIDLYSSTPGGQQSRLLAGTSYTALEMYDFGGGQGYCDIRLYNTPQTAGDGSTNNQMVVRDQQLTKGLVYDGNYSANFTTYSLVTKGWVNSQISAVTASGVTGSGIANYVPYWLTTSQLTSGSIYDSGTAIGVGTVSNGLYRVNISGDVNILGTLYATSKSFEIIHPLDPSKRLTYGSLEGPEYGVYYRGKLERNNIIDLPNYWTGLVDESSITVNITPIGFHQRIFVEKIENNKVYLGVDNSGPPNCYYIVYAERKDIPKIIVE